MAKKQDFRLGHQISTLGGVRRDCQPGAIPPNQFRDAINVRFSGGGISERGGQSKLNVNQVLEGCITGIIPGDAIPVNYSEQVMFVSEFDISVPGTDSTYSTYDPSFGFLTPADIGIAMDRAVFLQYAEGDLSGGAGGALIAGSGHRTADVAFSGPAVREDLFNQDAASFNFFGGGGDSDNTGALALFNGHYYGIYSQDTNGDVTRHVVKAGFAPWATGTSADIVRVVSFVTETDVTDRSPWLVNFKGENLLVAALEKEAIHAMSADGVWRRYPLPTACTLNDRTPYHAVEYDGNLYFTGYGPGLGGLLYRFDGSEVVPETEITSEDYQPVAVFHGVLYYMSGSNTRGGFDGDAHDAGVHTFGGGVNVVQLLVGYESLFALRVDTLEFAQNPAGDWTVAATEPGAFVSGANYITLDSGTDSTTVLPELVVTNFPRIYSHEPGGQVWDSIGVPSNQTYPNRRPSWITYEDRRIIVGPYERGVLVTPGGASVLLGITAPAVAPVLTSAGGGSLTGNMIGYFSWVHKENGVDIHESDLSPGSNTLTLSGTQQRDWTWSDGAAEPRVTHTRLYVSVDGALPRFVMDLPVGTETVTEDTAAAALGDTPPVDADGNLANARGVPPYAQFVEKYHDRAVYGPDPDAPYRFWLSEIGEPESVGPLSYFDLRDREGLTCLKRAGDDLVTAGAHVLYNFTGYDENDFQMHKVSDSVGILCHFACIAINEILWFPAQLGIFNYIPGGVIRYMLGDDLRTWWKDEYKNFPSLFERSVAINDKEESVYKFLLVYPTLPGSRYLVGHYTDIDPSMGGVGPMRWTFDYRNRRDSIVGVLLDPGTLREQVYAGTCDGYLRRENDYTNADDDADGYGKRLTLETAHFLPKSGQGSSASSGVDGAFLQLLSLYVQSEEKAWDLEVRVGQDNAYLSQHPAYQRRVRASAKTIAGRRRVQQTGHQFTPMVSGAGWIIKISQLNAIGFTYAGLSFQWEQGFGAGPRR